MAIEKSLDNILNTNSKVRVIRLFISKREDFVATGREIARLIGITAPAVHTALKDLYSQDVLKRNIISGHHQYKLNTISRIVKDILTPAFKKELSIKKDVSAFLRKQIKKGNIENEIVSLILYGSFQAGITDETSDVDIAVVAKNKTAKEKIEKMFAEIISEEFHDYFGTHLDVYIKTKNEFLNRLKKKQPPVSALLKSYSVIYGRDVLDIK